MLRGAMRGLNFAAASLLLFGFNLAFAQAPPNTAPGGDADEPEPRVEGDGHPGDGSPGDAPPGGVPPTDDGDRADLIEIRIAFDDRSGAQLRNGFATLKPDNDPATRKCIFVDDGRGDDETKGDGVYMCATAIQRSQSVSMTVFHKPGAKELLLVKAMIKLPSAPTASIAIRAPANFATGDFKVLDPFYFMEPDSTGDGPDDGGSGGDVLGLLGGGDGSDDGRGDKPTGPPDSSSVTTIAPNTGGSQTAAGGSSPGSGSNTNTALWLVVGLMAALQLIRLRAPSRLAGFIERLRASLVVHGRPLLAEVLPDLRRPAAAMEGWVLPAASMATPPAPAPAAAPAAPPERWSLPRPADLFRRGGQSDNPSWVEGFDPRAAVAHLHKRGLLPVALWDAFPLSGKHPTALLVDGGDPSPATLTALVRETAGRLGLPTVLIASTEQVGGARRLLISAEHLHRPYPPPAWRPGLDSAGSDHKPGPPEVGDRLFFLTSQLNDLKATRAYLARLEASYGAVCVIIADPAATGLTDDLITPEAAATELLSLVGALVDELRAYVLIVGSDPATVAMGEALGDQATTAAACIRLRLLEEDLGVDAQETGPSGRRASLRALPERGWMWATAQSQPVAPVADLARVLSRSGEAG